MCLHGFDQSGQEQPVFRSLQLRREQRQPDFLEDLLDVLRHLAGQQLGREQRLAGQRLDQLRPLGVGKRLDLDA